MFEARSRGEALARQLEKTQTQALARLTDVDSQLVIYSDGGWRVQDIIAHLTVWEEEIARSLQAYQYGSAYRIPDFELQAFNWANYEQRKVLPSRQVFADWMTIRGQLRWLVTIFPVEKLGGQMTYPSSRRGECEALILEVMSHQAEHMDDILNVVKGDKADDEPSD
jgi:hypothetical protein